MRRNGAVSVILALALLVPLGLSAQQARDYVIRGSVTGSEAAQPLAGVQVTIQGTRFGTLTDDAGRYQLRATLPEGDYTLVYNFIGRGTESVPVTLGTQTAVTVEDVVLSPSAVQLDEIVVTGTGAPTAKRALGNTIATVSGAEVNDAPGAASVDVALQGKVTGAVISENSGQPGGGVSIRLRGTSSILGGAEPLIVVDGVIVDNSSSAMISLGANAGRGNAALTNRLADISASDIESIEVIKGAAAAALYGSKANNGVIQIFTRQGRQGAPQIRLNTEFSVARTPDQYDLMMAERASFADVAFGLADAVGDPIERFDIQDELFRTGLGSRTNVSVSGGNESTTYYLAGGYQNEQGILESSAYDKIDARLKVGQVVTGWLDVNASGHLIQSEADLVPEGEQTQGVLTSVIFTPPSFDPSFNEELGRFPHNPILGWNPLDVITNWDAEDNVNRFVGSLGATARPTDDLTFRYLFGYDDYRQTNRYFQPPLSSPGFRGRIDNPIRVSRQLNHDLTATHTAEFGESIGLESTAGTRYTEDRAEVISSSALDLPPGQELVGGATLVTGQSRSELNTFGVFLQERISFRDRLYLTGGVNYEASSAFGEDERWQLFPRASISYVVDDEPYFSESPVGDLVSTFRVRAAYGQTGGQPPGPYDRFSNYFDVGFAGRPGLVASTVAPNPGLKPERQTELEAGFDLGLWGDRAVVDFTYYTQTTDDLVLNVPLPPSSAFQLRRENIGELTNKGIELALTTINMARGDFTWRSRFQFATNSNEVTRLVTAADTLISGYLNAVIEGQPVGVFYGGIYARNPDGSLAINPANDLPFRARDTTNVALCATSAALGCPFAARVLGDPNPDFTLSLSNDLAIGPNLTFGFLLDGRFGNDVANFTRRITEFFGADAVVEREVTGEVPSRFYTLNPNGRIQVYEEYIEDGSFVKLREIALGYRFTQPWLQSFLGAESMRLRLAGRDLYTWTEYSGLDPEVNLFSANTVARGVDFATTPLPRKFVVGLDFTF